MIIIKIKEKLLFLLVIFYPISENCSGLRDKKPLVAMYAKFVQGDKTITPIYTFSCMNNFNESFTKTFFLNLLPSFGIFFLKKYVNSITAIFLQKNLKNRFIYLAYPLQSSINIIANKTIIDVSNKILLKIGYSDVTKDDLSGVGEGLIAFERIFGDFFDTTFSFYEIAHLYNKNKVKNWKNILCKGILYGFLFFGSKKITEKTNQIRIENGYSFALQGISKLVKGYDDFSDNFYKKHLIGLSTFMDKFYFSLSSCKLKIINDFIFPLIGVEPALYNFCTYFYDFFSTLYILHAAKDIKKKPNETIFKEKKNEECIKTKREEYATEHQNDYNCAIKYFHDTFLETESCENGELKFLKIFEKTKGRAKKNKKNKKNNYESKSFYHILKLLGEKIFSVYKKEEEKKEEKNFGNMIGLIDPLVTDEGCQIRPILFRAIFAKEKEINEMEKIFLGAAALLSYTKSELVVFGIRFDVQTTNSDQLITFLSLDQNKINNANEMINKLRLLLNSMTMEFFIQYIPDVFFNLHDKYLDFCFLGEKRTFAQGGARALTIAYEPATLLLFEDTFKESTFALRFESHRVEKYSFNPTTKQLIIEDFCPQKTTYILSQIDNKNKKSEIIPLIDCGIALVNMNRDQVKESIRLIEEEIKKMNFKAFFEKYLQPGGAVSYCLENNGLRGPNEEERQKLSKKLDDCKDFPCFISSVTAPLKRKFTIGEENIPIFFDVIFKQKKENQSLTFSSHITYQNDECIGILGGKKQCIIFYIEHIRSAIKTEGGKFFIPSMPKRKEENGQLVDRFFIEKNLSLSQVKSIKNGWYFTGNYLKIKKENECWESEEFL